MFSTERIRAQAKKLGSTLPKLTRPITNGSSQEHGTTKTNQANLRTCQCCSKTGWTPTQLWNMFSHRKHVGRVLELISIGIRPALFI
jgi:hypothetical protein